MKRSNAAGRFMVRCVFALMLGVPHHATAHCDGMDGPVVKAAQKALATANVNFVLIWVQPGDEDEIRTAFAKTLAVRKINSQARELADVYFFETLVRVHRAGEGAPYMGLMPAGRDLGPAITAADKVVQEGNVDSLVEMISSASASGIRTRFQKIAATRNFKTDDVAAGRRFVKAYSEFLHYIEGLHESIHRSGHEHAPETGSAHKDTEQ